MTTLKSSTHSLGINTSPKEKSPGEVRYEQWSKAWKQAERDHDVSSLKTLWQAGLKKGSGFTRKAWTEIAYYKDRMVIDAASTGHLALVQWMMLGEEWESWGMSRFTVERNTADPLAYACAHNQKEVVQWLLHDPELKGRGEQAHLHRQEWLALRMAAQHGHLELLKTLIPLAAQDPVALAKPDGHWIWGDEESLFRTLILYRRMECVRWWVMDPEVTAQRHGVDWNPFAKDGQVLRVMCSLGNKEGLEHWFTEVKSWYAQQSASPEEQDQKAVWFERVSVLVLEDYPSVKAWWESLVLTHGLQEDMKKLLDAGEEGLDSHRPSKRL